MTKNKTLTDEAFEKWFGETYKDLQFNKAGMIDAWQAAKQESAKEIEQLHKDCAYFQGLAVDNGIAFSTKMIEIIELQSQVNILREALYKLTQDAGEDDLSLIRQALSATAEQSLAEHDNATIERIATALENAEGELKYLPEYVSLVRGMKATP